MTRLKRTNSDDADFQHLVTLLDDDLAVRDGADHAFYHQFNKTTGLGHTIVAYVNDTSVGCGAFKPFEVNSVEIKRMYVLPSFRGKGIAAKILHELEHWARETGYEYCVLETGKKQPEAIALYTKEGYTINPNYGQYRGIENSVCMKKALQAPNEA